MGRDGAVMELTARWVGYSLGDDVFVWWRGSAPPPRGRAPSPHWQELFCRGFFIHNHLQVRGHILVQLDRDDKFADALERLVQLYLPAIDVEALLFERFGNIASRDRSEQVIAFARLAQELHFDPVKLLGQRFGFGLF